MPAPVAAVDRAEGDAGLAAPGAGRGDALLAVMGEPNGELKGEPANAGEAADRCDSGDTAESIACTLCTSPRHFFCCF